MNPQDAIDLGREAIRACFMVGGPILLASLLIGLLVGVLQAMTQVQDQTVSFVPKLLCLLAILGLCLPWLTDQLVEYGKQTWSKPMTHFHVGSAPANAASLELPFSQTAGRLPEKSRALQGPTNPEKTERPDEQLQSPFSLPHYRYSRLPKTDIDG